MRRFNADNGEMRDFITTDEGDVPRVRLRGGALTGFSEDGCSVARDSILTRAAIARSEVLEPRYQSLAEASVESVREFELHHADGTRLRPFSVVADAYPPNEPNPRRWMVAHALVTIVSLTKADKKAAVGALARTTFNPLQDSQIHHNN